jgi:hypothetical protein
MSKDKERAFAAKKFKIPNTMMNETEELSYKRELNILQQTSHPFIVKYVEEFLYN